MIVGIVAPYLEDPVIACSRECNVNRARIVVRTALEGVEADADGRKQPNCRERIHATNTGNEAMARSFHGDS